MAVYNVEAPDGSIHRVEAPDNARPEEVRAHVMQSLGQPHGGQGVLNSLHGAASAALDGAVPGAGGVASGLVSMAGNAFAAPFSSHVSFDPAGAFRSGREAGERHEEVFKQDHPTLGTAATAAGFVGSLALPVTKLGLGARGVQAVLRGRMANAAANGALYGAAGGLLDSHADNVGDAIRDTVRGGTVGAGAGGALPLLGRVVAPIGAPVSAAVGRMVAPGLEAVARHLPGSAGRHLQNRAAALTADPVHVQAGHIIGQAMDDAGMDGAALMHELRRRQALGVPAVPADTAEPLRGAYGLAARRPGPAVASVRRMIDARQLQQASRAVQHVEGTLGPTTNVERQADQLNAQALRDARPLYELSNAQDIPLTPELRELFSRPAGRAAMHEAGVELSNEGINPLDHGLIQEADGSWSMGAKPTMAAYDHAKTVLDRTAFAGDKPFATPETDRASRGAKVIRGRLLDLMDGFEVPHVNGEVPALAAPQSVSARYGLPTPPPSPGGPNGLNPYWKPARDAYAGPVGNRKALTLGEDMAKANATDAGNRMEGMGPSELDHFRLGHRTGLASEVGTMGGLCRRRKSPCGLSRQARSP